MFTNRKEVFQWIDEVCTQKIQPGLERMEWLLEQLNHPERRCKFIHIAGTNGKGSTAAMLSSVLQANYTTGLYVSPSVRNWNERIQVNGKYIPDESFVSWVNKLRELVEEMGKLPIGSPSPFEFYTILALCYFAYEACPQFVVWETGLGGKYDATNVVHPLVSIITRIGMDHTDWLGSTLEEIALEKAGIIKKGIPVVCSKQALEVEEVLKKQAKKCNSSIYIGEKEFSILSYEKNELSQMFTFTSIFRTLPSLTISLLGKHQLENVSTILMALELLQNQYAIVLEIEDIREGLRSVEWPGRIEKVCESPIIILDGAHNEDSMKALLETIETTFPNRRLLGMIAMMKDKKVEKVVFPLLSRADKVVITELPDEGRSYLKEDLVEIIKRHEKPIDVTPLSIQEGIAQLKEWATPNDVILITGSFFLVSKVRSYFVENQFEDGDFFA